MAYEFIGQAAVNTANAITQHCVTYPQIPINADIIKSILNDEVEKLGYSPESAKGSLTAFKALAEAGYIKGVPPGTYIEQSNNSKVHPCNKDRAIALRDKIINNGNIWPTLISNTQNQYDDQNLWNAIATQVSTQPLTTNAPSNGCVAAIRGLFDAGILI